MNNQNPNPNPPPSINPLSDQPFNMGNSSPSYHDWREQRRAERWARHEASWQRHAGRPYGWIVGSILALLGSIFLLQNLGFPFLMNWWALIILIPVFWAYIAVWNVYQENHQLTRRGAGLLTMGILLTFLTLIFLLNLDVGLVWPALLIVGGWYCLGWRLFLPTQVSKVKM